MCCLLVLDSVTSLFDTTRARRASRLKLRSPRKIDALYTAHATHSDAELGEETKSTREMCKPAEASATTNGVR